MTTAPVGDGAPFSHVYAAALRGGPCEVVDPDGAPRLLPVGNWRRTADAADRAVLARCVGATLDVGCGPGRMAEHLQRSGHVVLAIDVVSEAVAQARARGVSALRRDVFDNLPGEGRWETALLADGNIGIGGDPVALLARVHELLGPRGRVVLDVEPPGAGLRTRLLRLAVDGTWSKPFAWARVGVDVIGALAAVAGFERSSTHEYGGRWFAVLERT